MATRYPAQIDDSSTLAVSADNSTHVRASVINEIRSAIINIESALGTNPASVYGSVKERLNTIESVVSSLSGGDSAIVFSGDLSGSSISQTVIGLQGNSVSDDAPSDGYILTWESATDSWRPKSAPVSFTAGNDLSGTNTSQTVIKINGTSVPAGGALTTGQILRVTGSSSMAYGALDLSNTNATTGTLSASKQSAQTVGGDLSGTTSSATVVSVNGTTVPAGGSLTTGQILRVSGSSAMTYGALDLSNSNATTGTLSASKQSAQTVGGDLSGTTASATVAKVNGVSISGTASNGTVLVASSSSAASWTSQTPTTKCFTYSIATYAQALAGTWGTGDFSTGLKFSVNNSNAVVTGIRIWAKWTGTNSRSIRFCLWNNVGTRLVNETENVSGNAGTLFTHTFATPQTLTVGQFYVVSAYDTTATNYPLATAWSNGPTMPFIFYVDSANNFQGSAQLMQWSAGNIFPASGTYNGSSGEFYPVEPVFQ